MTTMIVDVESSADIGHVAAAMRQLKGVARVRIRKDDSERIPGLPCTHDEYMNDIHRAEEDYAAGRTVTSEEAGKKIAAW
ncbi:MAG: hypothetical protein LBV26_06210 [Bacteroidales bacterium]|jgi:hypothetical protein|nr:hypothetical protein [Bacteroidales bacterium]